MSILNIDYDTRGSLAPFSGNFIKSLKSVFPLKIWILATTKKKESRIPSRKLKYQTIK